MARQIPQNNHVASVRAVNEKAMGIIFHATPFDSGLQADIRKRYSDFLVNEVLKSGSVVHLLDYETRDETRDNTASSSGTAKDFTRDDRQRPAAAPSSGQTGLIQVLEHDREVLEKLVGQETTKKLIDLDRAIQTKSAEKSKPQPVVFPTPLDRNERTVTHQEIRRVFSSRIATITDNAGVITATPMTASLSRGANDRNRQTRGGRAGPKPFAELGGEFLHFTLYKENRDTMDAINTIARMLKLKANNFGFAGTKDRRAVTTQRISVHRQRAENLIWLNNRIPGVRLGAFEHHPYKVSLGQHGGNQFVITLKNCHLARGTGCSLERQVELVTQTVEAALTHINKHGFINYFGLQRFGTHTIGSHELGMKILQGDFEAAIDAILHVDSELMSATLLNGTTPDYAVNPDEAARARAIGIFKATRDAELALKIMPKRFSAEANMIRHLSGPTAKRDYVGALLTIARGTRAIYLHAYQSYVWNHAASYRWSKFGSKVIVGDMVLLNNDVAQPKGTGDDLPDMDQDDERFHVTGRSLTAEDVASGQYTIFDVVLPSPGFDVNYPENEVGAFYKEFMAREENGGLNPYDMRRVQREFSLPGDYRYLIGRFHGAPGFSVRTYTDDTEQMYPTDEDIINQRRAMERKKAHGEVRERSVPTAESSSGNAMADRNVRRQQLIQSNTQLSAWNHFSNNAAMYDARDDEERRRVQASLPTPEGAGRIIDTWNEHVVKGNKRVKVTKHVIEHQAPNPVPTGKLIDVDDFPVSGNVTMKFSPEPDNFWGSSALVPPPATNAWGPSVTGSKPDTHSPAETKSGGKRAASVDLLTPDYPERIDQLGPVTSDSSHRSTPEPSRVTEQAEQKLAIATLRESPAPTTRGSIISAPRSKSPVGMTVPKFRYVGMDSTSTGSNSETSTSNTVDDHIMFNPEHQKIAVTLQFTLGNSKYATIALREIMGSASEQASPVLSDRRESP